MTPTLPALIAEIDALEAAAAPGPWEADTGSDGMGWIKGPNGRDVTCWGARECSYSENEAHGALIAALRNAWPTIKAVMVDAQRYRWLRSQHSEGIPKLHYIQLAGQDIPWHFPSPETVDAAIDAARSRP